MYNGIGITTHDNPFNQFEDFDNWYMFDMTKGYNTCALVARHARTSDQLTDELNEKEVERAIDLIISTDFENIYKKVRYSKSS